MENIRWEQETEARMFIQDPIMDGLWVMRQRNVGFFFSLEIQNALKILNREGM